MIAEEDTSPAERVLSPPAAPNRAGFQNEGESASLPSEEKSKRGPRHVTKVRRGLERNGHSHACILDEGSGSKILRPIVRIPLRGDRRGACWTLDAGHVLLLSLLPPSCLCAFRICTA